MNFSAQNVTDFFQEKKYRPYVSITSVVSYFYVLIFASFFFLNTSAQRDVLYVALPFFLYFTYKNKDILTYKNFVWPLLGLLLAYFSINFLSIFWSEPEKLEKLFQRLKMVMLFPLSLIPFMILNAIDIRHWYRALTGFVAAAIVTAAGLLIVYGHDILNGARLEGWGRGENPVLCGLLYGLTCLLMIFCKDHIYGFRKFHPLLQIALTFLPFAILVASLSRGPFGATIVTAVAVCILMSETFKAFFCRKTICIILTLIAGVGVFLYNGYGYFKDRGTTGRSQIWEQAIDHIKEKPILGHGIATKFLYKVEKNNRNYMYGHTHSVYLSALVHTGIIGLLFQLGALVAGAYYAVRHMRRYKDAAPFIFLSVGALLGLIDIGGYYTNLGITWLIFWFPLVLLSMHKSDEPASTLQVTK